MERFLVKKIQGKDENSFAFKIVVDAPYLSFFVLNQLFLFKLTLKLFLVSGNHFFIETTVARFVVLMEKFLNMLC